jgi:magnesium-transporting ATPase (P-type)
MRKILQHGNNITDNLLEVFSMKNFLISAAVDIILIFISYFLFRNIISGPTRHRLYEKFFGSFAKFVIYTFIATLIITGVTALILYRTWYIAYINILAPALVSILVGFLMSTVPTRGAGDEKSKQ